MRRVAAFGRRVRARPRGGRGGMIISTWSRVHAWQPRILAPSTARGSGRGGGSRKALNRGPTGGGLPQAETRAHGIAQPHMCDRVARVLAAITARLLRRILGDARRVVRSPQAPQGGRGGWGWGGSERLGRARPLRPRPDAGAHVRRGAPKALRQLAPGPAWRLSQGVPRRLSDDHQDLEPRRRLALADAAPPPLSDVERRGLQGDPDQQEPSLRRRPWTVRVGGGPPGGARGPSRRHAAMWRWKAVSKGGTDGRNSSRVRRVQASPSVGRVWRSANRHVPIAVASVVGGPGYHQSR